MKPNKLFVYGILKRGYELDLSDHKATFLGDAHIDGAVLYGIGHIWRHESHPNEGRQYHGVGLKLDVGPLEVAYGELWDIPNTLWDWLDSIEQNGYVYTRKVVPVKLQEYPAGAPYDSEVYKTVDAWTYEHCYPDFSYDNKIEGGKF